MAIIDGGSLHLDAAHDFLGRQRDLQIWEVDTSNKLSNGRHDDIVYNRWDDFAESTADDDTDSHVNSIALHGKLLELVNKFTH